MSRKRKLRFGIAVVALVVVGTGVAAGWQRLRAASRAGGIPTTRVQRGNLELKVYTTGELRPAKSAMLTAPPVSGTLQIVTLLKTGTLVKAGDLVIEFDPSEQEYNLEQARSQVLQAEQEITKSKADAAVQAAQDQVALLKAKFDVRRAELEVSRNELVSAIDARKNLLNLEEARRRLAQLEKDMESRKTSSLASLAVVEEKRNKERLAMQQAQQNIDNMRVRAPLDGLVAVKENRDSTGGFFTTGMVLPEYREGDLVWPGRFIAEVLEVQQMEILAKVNESDRSNVNPGQAVEVRVDTLPGQSFSGKVKTVAGMASRSNWWSGEGSKKFDATFQIDNADARFRPGVTAQVIVVGDEVKNSLFLPRQVVFEKEGKPVVYVKTGSGFESRDIKIVHRTESHIVVEGLAEGTEVALANPEAKQKKPGKTPAPGAPAIAGGGGR